MVGAVKDTVVIGAGPIGSYASILLASMGFEVVLLEEHPHVGRPVQCAGLVNSRISGLPHMKELSGSVLNRIRGADLFSPSGTKLEIRARTDKALSIDRAAFDLALAKRAVELGTDLRTGCRAVSVDTVDGRWSVRVKGMGGTSEIKAGSVLFCDGSDHNIRRKLGLHLPQEFVPGISCEVQADDSSYDDKNVAVFTGKGIAPGFFAWAIPAGGRGRLKIGLCTSSAGDRRPFLRRLLGDRALAEWVNPGKSVSFGEISLTIGTVPLGPVEPHQRPGILLLGDAAGMAKPTSGGGIYPGLLSVKSLCDAIESSGEGLTDEAFSRFSRSWRRGYGKELRRSMMLRGLVKDVEDCEIDLAFSELRGSDVMDYVNEKGDIDRPFTLAANVFARDPSLARLVPRFLPRILRALSS